MGRTSDARERILAAALDLIWRHSYCSVTVDAICAEADVRKGSFYHFFECKAEPAEEAFAALWDRIRPQLESIFSTEVPPLRRLRGYFRFVHEMQRELKRKYGRVVGCPFAALGSELSLRNEPICRLARSVLACYRKYFERTLRDAQAEGVIQIKNLSAAVQRLSAYIEGSLLQARVQNDLRLLYDLMSGALMVIGAQPLQSPKTRRVPLWRVPKVSAA